MDGDEVGFGDELIEGQQLDTHLTSAIGRHEGVVCHEAHAECLGPVGDKLANAAEANNAQRLVGELDTLPTRALPTARLERCVSLRNVAGLREQQRHRVLGGRNDVRLRSVDHHDAATRSCFDIDIVEADASTTHHKQVGSNLEQLGSDLRC